MNKAELIKAVADKAEVSTRDAEAVLDGVIELVTAALIKGESVKLSGFGDPRFEIRRLQTLQDPQRKASVSDSQSGGLSQAPFSI